VIDLPVGKALIAEVLELKCDRRCEVEPDYNCPTQECCNGCIALENKIGGSPDDTVCGLFCCFPENRRDGKNVVIKMVDRKD
jgi:hypothetical protein